MTKLRKNNNYVLGLDVGVTYVYHTNDYAFSCLAQREDGTYYLINFWNGMRDEKIQDFLEELDVYNAIRLDGGTSTSMCYETDYVIEEE